MTYEARIYPETDVWGFDPDIIIYDKYIFNIDDPECQSVINIEWKFKTIYKKKTGGRENGTKQRN